MLHTLPTATPSLVADLPPMITWLYSLTNIQQCALVILVFVTVSVTGQQVVHALLSRLELHENHNEFVAQFLAVAGVLYSLILGLVAVSVWQSFEQIEGNLEREATKLTSLYRTVECLPPEVGGPVANSLRAFVKQSIEVDWPLQQKGEIPPPCSLLTNDIRGALFAFRPTGDREKTTQSEALRLLNEMIELRQLRLCGVRDASLSPALWGVIVGGSLLTLAFTWFLFLTCRWLRLVMSSLLGMVLGLMVFIVLAMDYPFVGKFSISPSALLLTYERMTAPIVPSPNTTAPTPAAKGIEPQIPPCERQVEPATK